MSKTFAKLLANRPWIKYIDDERGDGNSIIVTLDSEYDFDDNPGCGVQGFDTVKEVEMATRRHNVTPNKNSHIDKIIVHLGRTFKVLAAGDKRDGNTWCSLLSLTPEKIGKEYKLMAISDWVDTAVLQAASR